MGASANDAPLRQPVECRLFIDDEELAAFYPWLREVQVSLERGAAGVGTLSFDTFRDETGEWWLQDSELLRPWRRVVVMAAFGDHQQPVLHGVIREVTVTTPESMAEARVEVALQDESLLLDRGHHRRCWSRRDEPRRDGEIAAEIAASHGLGFEGDDGLTNAALNQDETDIRFLRRRAEANGFELFVEQGVLHFHAPRLEAGDQPPLLVHAGSDTNCLSVDIRHDGHLPDAVRVVRADADESEAHAELHEPDLPLLGRQSAGSAGMGHEPFVWDLPRPGGATQAEVVARAIAAANENAWKVVAEGELDGVRYGHVLRPHGTVVIDGVGSTYGGRYYVAEVTHRFAADGYRQRFRLIRNALGQDAWPES